MFGQSLLSAFGSAVACTTDTDQLFTTNVQTTSLATYQLNNATTSIPSNTYPGTPSNITYAAGKFGNAAVFNGTSSTIATPITTNYSNLSISCWVKFDALPTGGADATLVSKGFYTSGSSTQYLHLRYEDYLSKGFTFAIRNNSAYNSQAIAGVTATLGVWYHVVGILDSSGNAQIYVNGVAGTGITGAPSMTNSNAFEIGSFISTSALLNGSIDQVRIFNSALPQTAVTALYNETTTTATYPYITTEVANPNSVAYYKMSDATDQIGGNTLTNSNVNFNTEGKFGFAGAFNGSNSKLTISNSSFLPQGNNSRSISCWINTTGGSNDGVIGYGNTSNSQAFFIYITVQNKLGIYCYYNNTDGNIVISNNTWNHVVATYDGTNCKLYVNGVLDFTTAKTLNTGNGEFRIGGVNWNNTAEFFPGDIDQIRIYDSAISAADVTTLYNEIECPTVAVTNAFNTVLYTGNSTNDQSITGVGFKPDFVWIKSRNTGTGTTYHGLWDSVRGTGGQLYSELANPETNTPNRLYSFDSDGFSLGNGVDPEYIGNNNYVSWNWCAPTAETNNAGSNGATKTTTIKKNVDAGFSVVLSQTVTNVVEKFGHGLSSAPELILLKTVDSSQNWLVYHKDVGTGRFLNLNTDAAATSAGSYPDIFKSVTSQIIETKFDAADTRLVFYCFTSIPGYSQIGSYDGGDTTSVKYTGFEPSWIMVKGYSNSGSWIILDNKRNTSNPRNKRLYPSSSTSEAINTNLNTNFVSNGFVTVGTDVDFNGSGRKYIFLAIA